MANPEIKLKVMEAVQDDVNKGIVKIDSSFMKQIGVNPGEFVEVKGERSTAAVVDRAYPGDIGLNIVRMDGNIRRNARTSIGDLVVVRKADVKPAKKVSIAPAQKGIMVKAPPNLFKQGLLGKVVVKGDIVSLGRRRRRVDAMGHEIDDIFSMMEGVQFPGFGFGDLKFMVVDTQPRKEIVVITAETEVEFKPEAVELLKEEETLSLGVNYEDIGGLGEEIRKVREMVELPLQHPEIFEKLGIEPPKGVLLHGPPGTGKTLLAKAVASETNSHFILINGPEVMSKFYGESEANLRKTFEEAEQNAPSIIFFDEIDAIATKREETKGDVEKRVVAQLLGLMDGLKSRGKVIVIAATNMPNSLDLALRRPGRFDREIELGVPGKEGRLEILKIHTRNMPIEGTLYPDIVALILLDVLDKEIKKLSRDIEQKQDKLIQLQSRKEKDDQKAWSEMLELVKGLSTKIEVLKKEIEILSSMKIDLFKEKQKLTKLVDEFIKWEETKKKHKMTDPQHQIIENKQSDYLKELQKFNLNGLINENARTKGVERDLSEIARVTHGFVGADLNSLAKESAMIVLRKILPDLKVGGLKEDQPIPPEILEKLKVELKDFIDALRVVRPSAMREVLVETPDVTWNDVGGLDDVKEKLKEAVEWPLTRPEAFKRMGIRPPRGILLYGPPGTGKTLLAKAVAKESEANFILVNGPSLLSKWVGESEKAVREIFRKARQTAPTILFFDEIDALVPRRNSEGDSRVGERVVNQLLTEMDGLESLNDVLVIGATNRPDMVDPAILRQGRFDRIIYIPVPEEQSRAKIFEVHLKKMPLANDVDVQELAKKTKGYVGADVEGVCREAGMLALREDPKAKTVAMKHFKKALDVVHPSVDKDVEDAYQDLENYFSSARARQVKKKEDKASYVG
ncbi:TPA: CDC48 family AAA ATPase [Candidatus Woesearchaeota archaeon]|nr:CDC48 family AAA ATPase [Candidatus Woesearchaeota archaeon]